jgi:hypothetical protein
MKKVTWAIIVLIITSFWVHSRLFQGQSLGQTFSREMFDNPPIHYWPKPLWFWNDSITEEGIVSQIQAMRDKSGYGGFLIIPFRKNFRPEYLSDDYFRLYGIALEKARELGMTVFLYDEYGFPSGTVGGSSSGDGIPRFRNKYPEYTIKRLDKTEEEVSGPGYYERKVPEEILMGVVAMETTTMERIDLTELVSDRSLKWDVPSGKWKIMIFNCVTDGNPGADYLDPEAVRKFIDITHEAYLNHFKEYFGTVIIGTFFDEPGMFRARFRMWTDKFNEKFEKRYGFNPVRLYPAIWYDIGPETQLARNYLFGFRAELFANGIVKELNDWSVAQGITATGHIAPEEVLIPTNSSGDLMKGYKYLEIPGIDKIGGGRPAELFYKIVSSAAYNWDKPLVMAESYGAMPDPNTPGDLTWNEIYSIAMDQYAKGINMLIPASVWYDDKNVHYKPDLSHRNPLYADSLQLFSQFLARLNVMLQNDGRHVADIAILYPIHTLLGKHYFDGPRGPSNYDGPYPFDDEYYKASVSEIDYVDVANWLTDIVGKDYTFIHPEVLDEKCKIVEGLLHLQNKTNWENYKLLIIPSSKTISSTNLHKIKAFYENGGNVIFTTNLPSQSTDFNEDSIVIDLVKSIFPNGEKEAGRIISNDMGGKASYVSNPDGPGLRKIIHRMVNEFHVDYPVNQNIRYIHKAVDGRNLFYFANIGGTHIDTQVLLSGHLNLEYWDPHLGGNNILVTEKVEDNNSNTLFTRVNLNLKPYHSCFWVEEQ